MRTIAILWAVALAASIASAGDNWPQFRGPSGDGHSDAVGLPLRWSETQNVRWKTPIHGRGWSSPVVWGDQVWMTTATEDGREMFVVCVDLATGKILHDVRLFADIVVTQEMNPLNSFASPTPAIEQGRVYVALRHVRHGLSRYGHRAACSGCGATSSATITAGRARRPYSSATC